MIIIVSAMAKNRVIGNKDLIPWHLPRDLRHFKELTEGKTVLMGYKTFQSLVGYYQRSGKPMPYGRVVVYSDREGDVAGADLTAHSVDEILAIPGDIYVSGGGMMYEMMLPYADELELTFVDAEVEGDVFFPEIDFAQFEEVSREHFGADERNQYAMDFVRYRRKA